MKSNKFRTTASVDDLTAKKLADLAEKSGLSQSKILNLCLRYSLLRAPQPTHSELPYFPPPTTGGASASGPPRLEAE